MSLSGGPCRSHAACPHGQASKDTPPSHRNCVGTEGMGGREELEDTGKGICRDTGNGEQRLSLSCRVPEPGGGQGQRAWGGMGPARIHVVDSAGHRAGPVAIHRDFWGEVGPGHISRWGL